MPAEANSPVLPFTTGSTGMDTLLRSGIISVSTFTAGACVVFLTKHGYNDPSIGTLIFGAVFGIVGAALGALWGFLSQKWAKTAVVERAISAASSGNVAPEIIHSANPEQLQRIVDTGVAKTPAAEVALTAALNKAQVTQ